MERVESYEEMKMSWLRAYVVVSLLPFSVCESEEYGIAAEGWFGCLAGRPLFIVICR